MKPYLAALLAFSLLILVLVLLAPLAPDWSAWPAATCQTLEGCFCEAQRSGSVAQPVNAWSSLGFTLAGFLVAARAWGRQRRGRALIYVGALVLIGLGSAFYHASLSFVGQFFDVLGMYLLASFLALTDLEALGIVPRRRWLWLYVLVNVGLACALIWIPAARRWLFLGLILIVLGLELVLWRRRKPDRRIAYLWMALGAFGLAFLIWNLDNARIWCAPESWLQGHAAWHALGALAGWWMWRYIEAD